jgi:hypothetical protein
LFQITFGLSFLFLVPLVLKQQELQQHHVDQDNRKPSSAPKHGYLPKHGYSYSKDNVYGHHHHPDKDNTVFATVSGPKAKKKKHTQK